MLQKRTIVITRDDKIEKWSDIFNQLNVDVSKPITYVTAKQIKQITNEAASLMVKIDRIENMPKILRLLPFSRKEYAIVRGEGISQIRTNY